MIKILKIIFFLAVGFNLLFAAWHLLHQDVAFSSEIARDFFILREIQEKKLVLIGPSSSTGLFHGPLWAYVNFPAFLLGHGNPLVVEAGWMVFILAFIVSGFYIAKNLFDKTTAYFFTLINSLYIGFHSNGFYNPHGAMLLIPAFFYFFIRYLDTLELKYLVVHVLLAGFIIQFQMAVGIPLFLLTCFYIIITGIKAKNIKPIAVLLLISVTLINFIIFDLRHQFLLSHIVARYLLSPAYDHPSYLVLIAERLRLMFTSPEILRADPGFRNLGLFLIMLVLMFFQIKDHKYKKIYLSFLYFYCGFFILSIINTGPLLYFYLFPSFPLVLLIFSSFVTSRYKIIFMVLFFVVYAFNMNSALKDMSDAQSFFGRSIYSWKFLHNVAQKVFGSKEKEFGYFVYSPNVVAYEGKYTMAYNGQFYDKKVEYFTKKPVTFLVIAPPPSNNPYMKDEWWRDNQLKIQKKPKVTIKFDNGYKIEKYFLTNEETKIPFDQNIDPGLHFR